MSSTDTTQQAQTVYPQFVLDKILEISQKTGITTDALKVDYEGVYQDPFIQKDPQFTNDQERHKYACAILWTRFVGRQPLFDVSLIPVGVAGVRIAKKKGTRFSSLFVLMQDQQTKERKLARVSFFGETVNQIPGINFFNGYGVKLGKFRDGGDFVCDSRTKWSDPKPLPMKPAEMLEKLGTIKRVTLEKVASFPSVKDKTGFTNALDWRVVRGMIIRDPYSGVRKDGTDMFNYTIGDDSTGREDKTDSTGKVIRAGFTVWCDKLLGNFHQEDECDFYGTVDINKQDGSASMNAFMVLPVHARPTEAAP